MVPAACLALELVFRCLPVSMHSRDGLTCERGTLRIHGSYYQGGPARNMRCDKSYVGVCASLTTWHFTLLVCSWAVADHRQPPEWGSQVGAAATQGRGPWGGWHRVGVRWCLGYSQMSTLMFLGLMYSAAWWVGGKPHGRACCRPLPHSTLSRDWACAHVDPACSSSCVDGTCTTVSPVRPGRPA